MLYKCNYCDPTLTRKMREEGVKAKKSINTEIDEFVKDEKKKYYHINCFKKHLRERKKMDDESIESLLQERLKVTQEEVKETEQKDKLLKWIMKFYDGSLPTYFLKKLYSIRDGSFEGINEPVTYDTLLDIYIHMENYLRKRAAKMQIQNTTQRMNYDLAIVIGNYGDYKRFKERQKRNQVEETQIIKQTEVDKKITSVKKHASNKEDDFDITDVIDELLL